MKPLLILLLCCACATAPLRPLPAHDWTPAAPTAETLDEPPNLQGWGLVIGFMSGFALGALITWKMADAESHRPKGPTYQCTVCPNGE